MEIENKKQDQQDWQTEVIRINQRGALAGVLLAIITYCGGSTLGNSFNPASQQLSMLLWIAWLPAFCIIPCFVLYKTGKFPVQALNYVILLSMAFSASMLAGFTNSSANFRAASFSFFPIFIAFSLVTLSNLKHITIGILTSISLSIIFFVFLYPRPSLGIWVQTWTFIFPVAGGVVLLMNFRYRTLQKNFFITRALERSKAELEKKNEDILASISYAQRIQQAILPTQNDIKKYIPHYFLLFRPRDVVSGDFYFFTPTTTGYIVAVIDCTGHGVPGAFMSMIGNEILNEIINQRQITTPSEILGELHIAVRQSLKQKETENRDGMDLVLVHIEPNVKQFTFAGAKNSLYVVQDGKIVILKGNKFAIGGEQREQTRIFEQHVYEITPNMSLYLTSDGFIDQFGGKERKKFTASRFKELILQASTLPTEGQEKLFTSTFYQWMEEGNEQQIDDVLVWGIQLVL